MVDRIQIEKARSDILSSHSGLPDAPKPGCSGTITSWVSESLSMKGSQREAPLVPCRKRSGAPSPFRMMRISVPVMVSKLSVKLIGFPPSQVLITATASFLGTREWRQSV